MAQFFEVAPEQTGVPKWLTNRPKRTAGLFKVDPEESEGLPKNYIQIENYCGKRSDWAKFTGLNVHTINRRIRAGDTGWDIIRPLSTRVGFTPKDPKAYFEQHLTSNQEEA